MTRRGRSGVAPIAAKQQDPTRKKVVRKRARPAFAPRKRPSQDRAAETVATLVEAAAQVLETAGLEGFNTNAVAARAGVSVGSLYQYFAGKDGLLIALMRREDARFQHEAEAAFALDGGRAALVRYIEVAVRQQLARPRLARLLDVEEGRPEIQRALAGSKSFREMLEDVLGRDDLPCQASPSLAALDLSSIIRGLTDAAGERGETDVAGLEGRIGAAVFGYLGAMADASRPNRPRVVRAPSKNASKSSRSRVRDA